MGATEDAAMRRFKLRGAARYDPNLRQQPYVQACWGAGSAI
jgi:hypothetical protein